MNTYAAPSEIVPPAFNEYFAIRQPDGKYTSDHAGYQAAEAEYYRDLAIYVKAHFGGHKLAGEVVSVPYADGAAVYMIGKVNGKVSLFHIDLMDGWDDQRFTRLCTVAELTRMVEDGKRRAAFWASQQVDTAAQSAVG